MKSDYNFLNQVLEVGPGWTDLEELEDWIDRTERSLGRRRNETGRDRTIDIDLLFWGDRVASEPLVVPHPRLQERAFVLDPLVELAPDFLHPGLDRTVRQLQHELRSVPSAFEIERQESG